MVSKDTKRLGAALLLALFIACLPRGFAQEDGGRKANEDDMVRLVKAASVQIITGEDECTYRKATDATFLHNGTYLICDTAIWNVRDSIINAVGNVSLKQDGTTLTSETLDYLVAKSLAQFRGSVVQLVDKEGNTLRTRHLDYNTADSVAVFEGGAALKDKDGQIIESMEGTYDSKAELFTFVRDVDMFTDSIFIKTSSLHYHTDTQLAVFDADIDFWKEDNMLSARRGHYNRADETFFFTGAVHLLSPDYECWGDTLYYYRTPSDLELLGNVQLQDSVNRTSAVSDKLFYQDSLAKVTLTGEAAVAMVQETEAKLDTVYFGADTLIYYTLYKCDISENVVSAASGRLAELMTDPVGEYRRKAAEEAARKAEEESKNNVGGNSAPPLRGVGRPSVTNNSGAPKSTSVTEEPAVPLDSAGAAVRDTTALADSVAVVPAPDSTKVGFAIGLRNVKVYRKDLQVKCDSLHYCDLDSIARFYIDPVIWNDGNRQYYSDSLFVLVREGSMDRASLQGNAMIVTQEDTLLYDQIRGTEVLAYFDSTSALKRFDAIGGATAIFYLEESGSLSTVNKVESKMLSGVFKDGNIDRVYYFDSPKNDAYPLAQFSSSDRYLKGFSWDPDKRPSGKESITDLTVRPSERASYEVHPRPDFTQTDIYFPGYISSLYRSLEAARMEKQAPKAETPKEEKIVITADSVQRDSLKPASLDSLALKDSVMVTDSLAVTDSLVVADSSEVQIPKETIAQRFAKWRAGVIERREQRWATLDQRDSLRRVEKEQLELAKVREKKRKELIAIEQQKRDDSLTLKKYIQYYERRKAKEAENGKD